MQPKTQIPTTPQQAQAIRNAVRAVTHISPPYGNLDLATTQDTAEILALLMDERVSGDVYTLPRPFSLSSVRAYIKEHQEQARAGDGLLMCSRDGRGQIISLVDFQFWPEYSACEFGGVIAFEHQSKSIGTKGIKQLCAWTHGVIGINLLAMTTSLENIRSQKMLKRLGFTQLGEMESVRPDGGVRRSLYWELVEGV